MRRIAVATLLILLALPAWADFQDGLDAFNRGDYATALKEWQPLAEQGDVNAQFNLGVMYRKGNGEAQDDAEAMRWYRLAAEQGDAGAQTNLGAMYFYGEGAPQDHAEAAKWYRLAAEQGNANAQGNLADMYFQGLGVPQDYLQAHLWWNLAAAQGDEQARKFRDAVAAEMTPAQIEEAQRLARAWVAGGTGGSAANTVTSVTELELVATGTGFAVAPGGFVTNQHVVEGCQEVRIHQIGTATVIAVDEGNDLAYLTVDSEHELPLAVFRSQPKVERGETVVALGFPLHGTLASQGNVTVGTISALAGYADDFREYQFSAPIQPGNSGGPLLDRSGHVVGIVSSELVSEYAEEVPQNVNFAIKAPIVVVFLGALGIEPLVAVSDEPLEVEAVATLAEGYTRLVECWADPNAFY